MLKNRNESKFILKNLSLIYNLDSRAVSGPVEAAGESAATVTVGDHDSGLGLGGTASGSRTRKRGFSLESSVLATIRTVIGFGHQY